MLKTVISDAGTVPAIMNHFKSMGYVYFDVVSCCGMRLKMSDCDKIVIKERFWLLIISLKFLLNGQRVFLLFDPMCMFTASATGASLHLKCFQHCI